MKLHRLVLVDWGTRAALAIVWVALLAVNTADPMIWNPERGILPILLDVLVLPALALLMVAVAAEALVEERRHGAMRPRTRAILVWLPRALGILFCAFMSLFALDVFGMGLGFWQTLGALLIHLAPVLIVAALLAASWRWEWLGAVAFGAFGLWTLSFTAGGVMPFAVLLLVSITPLLLAGLFALAWVFRAETHARRNVVV